MSVPASLRDDEHFTGLMYGEHPGAGGTVRVRYENGRLRAVSYLTPRGWSEEAADYLSSRYVQGIVAAAGIGGYDVLMAVPDTLTYAAA